MHNDFISKAKAVVLGHAVGDALGVPVEFIPNGYDAIPEEWLKNLIEREYIEGICSSVFAE